MAECNGCIFFLHSDLETGICRRYPPAMTLASVKVKTVDVVEGENTVKETAFESNWQFPPMMNFGWCGEHRPRRKS